MRKYEASAFRADRAWSGPSLASIADAVVKLRWTDRPFRWHANTGPEVFAVLAGEVDMHMRSSGSPETVVRLAAGDLVCIEAGEEHVAHPIGEARILVIEESQG